VLNSAPHHEDAWECGGTVSHVLNLSTGWRWSVNFKPRVFYLQYPSNSRLGGHRS